MVGNEMGGSGGGVVVALVRDLMFASRVRGAAAGSSVVQRAEALEGAIGGETRLVLVDLQAPGAVEAIQGVRSAYPDLRIVAFGPHVAGHALEAASAAGAEAMPRGAFVKRLGALVAEAGAGRG